jgi:hypothetical protein
MTVRTVGKRTAAARRAAWRLIVAGALALTVLLVVLRAFILSEELAALGPAQGLALLAKASRQDALLVLALAAAGLLLARPRGARGRLAAGTAVFLLAATLVLLLGVANVGWARYLGEPPTAAWLRHADVWNPAFRGLRLEQVLAPERLIFGSLAVALFLSATLVLSRLVGWAAANAERALIVTALPVAAILAVPGLVAEAPPLDPGKGLSPLVAFAADLVSADPRLSPLPPEAPALPFGLATADPLPVAPLRPTGIRNVVVVLLGGVPATSVAGFGGDDAVTPNLGAWARVGLRFPNAYVHTPASAQTVAALLTGLPPAISPEPMSRTSDGLELQGLPSALKAAGLRTGFFSSSDTRFQGLDAFLARLGVDRVADLRDWDCLQELLTAGEVPPKIPPLSHDLCTALAAIDWMTSEPDRPFFAVLRTAMTRPPFFPGARAQTFVEDQPTYNRYLNALRIGDEAFGLVMERLRDRALLDSTLVIVTADQGQRFDGPAHLTRGPSASEADLRVPLLLLHPSLYGAEPALTVTGTSDLAPTILDLLDLPAPAGWQGVSLFATPRPDAVLFFAPWNGFEVGFREATRKYVERLADGRARLFDLAALGGEGADLAPGDPAAAGAAAATLRRWADTLAETYAALAPGGTGVAVRPALRPPPPRIVLFASGTRFDGPPLVEVRLDGASLGTVAVSGALDTAAAPASAEAIAAAVAPYRLSVPGTNCARSLEVWFLNDGWAGEGLPGDTNFFLSRVVVNGIAYGADRFVPLTPGAGEPVGTLFALWRDGGVRIDLEVPPGCQAPGSTAPAGRGLVR